MNKSGNSPRDAAELGQAVLESQQATPTDESSEPAARTGGSNSSVLAFGVAPRAVRARGPGALPADLTFPTISGFTILEQVGAGGFGVVFRAKQAQPSRDVAIKVVRPDLARDPRTAAAFLTQFAREIQIVADLRHLYIVQIYASGTFVEEGATLPYFAMEFIEDEPVQAYFRNHVVSLDETLELLAKILDGVHYAHLKGVIHRDLKPDNVAVRKVQNILIPVIRDFSIADTLTNCDETDDHAARPFGRAGTGAYSSPERIKGDSAPSYRDDVYSVAVMAYELITGQIPFVYDATEANSLASAIVARQYRSFDLLQQRAGSDAVYVIRRALGVEHAGTYDSAADFASDLRRLLDGDRPAARPPSLTDDLRRFSRRHRTAVVSAALLLLATAGGTITTTWQARRAAERTERLKQLAESVAFEITNFAESMPRTTYGRSELISRGVEVLESIAAEHAGDEGIQHSLARAYIVQARVIGDPGRPNLGDTERAIAIVRKAITLLSQRTDARSDPALRATLAHAYATLGRTLYASDLAGCADAIFTAHATYMALLADVPQSMDARVSVSHTLLVASQLAPIESRDRLHAAFEPTRAILERSTVLAPPSTRDELIADSDSFDALARVALNIGKTAEAQSLLEVSESLLHDAGGMTRFETAIRIVNLERARADFFRVTLDPDREIAQRRVAHERVVELLKDHPDPFPDTPTELLSAVEYAECAMRLRRDEEHATSLALGVARKWIERDPANAMSRDRLVTVLRYRIAWLGESEKTSDMQERRRLLEDLASLGSPPPLPSESAP